ncbi:MAG TPA: Ig-like domain-containing protein, partial [Chloroflexota bacterium]|nr:Ig-like domain-containing protein [Chloroflexota bacterium]
MRFAFLRIAALLTAVGALLVASLPSAAFAQTASGWQPGPGAVLDNTYDGYIDQPPNGGTVAGSGSFTVRGWFVDKTAQGWAGADDIQVWLGTMDAGGKMLAKAQFAQSRPDVAAATGNPFWAASGFLASVPGSSVPAGSQTLNVYAHTGGKGWWFRGVTVTGGGSATTAPAAAAAAAAPVSSSSGAPMLTITNPTANQNVSTKGDYTINGSVNDPSNIDRIEVWINGERDSQYGSLLGTTTPSSDGSWSITFKPTRYPSTHSNLYAYAHNRVTGLETVVNREINIVD